MNIQQLLQHHGIHRNPFAEEDAQVDPVFKDHCIDSTFHPVWDKVFGDPREPSTSIVFGPKGAGKTAMRLQIQKRVEQFNKDEPNRRVFLVRYDDFNPFIAQFQERLSARRRKSPEKTLALWRLWDHIDSILSIAVTDLVDRVLQTNSNIDPAMAISQEDVGKLSRPEARDLVLLTIAYDQSTQGVVADRVRELRKRLRYKNWSVHWDLGLAGVWALGAIGLMVSLCWNESIPLLRFAWLTPLLVLVGCIPFLLRWFRCQRLAMGIRKHMRVGNRDTGSLRRLLLGIPPRELASQPLPRHDGTDDRYGSLTKLQSLLRSLRFDGVLVLLDRLDEPQIVEGRVDRMKSLVWPLLDNKLLKHPGLGLKMMLPRELHREIEREDRSFHERARLDKQNVVNDFSWTGQSLYDIVGARIRACSDEKNGSAVEPHALFDQGISRERLLSAFETLRVPRHLFRCLYRMFVDHCTQYTNKDAQYRIKPETFEKTLAVYLRDVESASVN
jgi:hypothetical protein